MRYWTVVLASGVLVLTLSGFASAQPRQVKKDAGIGQVEQGPDRQAQGQGQQQRLRLRDGSCLNGSSECPLGNPQRLRLRDGSGCGMGPGYCGGMGAGRGMGGGRGQGFCGGMGGGRGMGPGGGAGMQYRHGQSN